MVHTFPLTVIAVAIFQLIYADLEERSFNNVLENLKQDNTYQVASKRESKLYEQYENLNL